MIIDHINHIEKYRSFGPGFESGIRFLLQHQNDPAQPVVRYKLDENVDVMVNQYKTKYPEESNFEAHNKYIDVQFMLKGDELVGWAPREKLSEISAAPERDYYELFGESDYFPLNEGYFMIFFPEDAHQPGLVKDYSEQVTKIVLKILAQGNFPL
mgnify:FL=1